MIYLLRYSAGNQSVKIAVVEDARHAERFEARGYSRCTYEAYRAAWRQNDARALARLRAKLDLELCEREVGGMG